MRKFTLSLVMLLISAFMTLSAEEPNYCIKFSTTTGHENAWDD